MTMLLSMAAALGLTLVLELTFALIWGLRKKELLLVVLMNILTNPAVNLLYLLAYQVGWNSVCRHGRLLLSGCDPSSVALCPACQSVLLRNRRTFETVHLKRRLFMKLLLTLLLVLLFTVTASADVVAGPIIALYIGINYVIPIILVIILIIVTVRLIRTIRSTKKKDRKED